MDDFNIIEFLKKIVAEGASDAHLYAGEYPCMRKDGYIVKFSDTQRLTVDDLNKSIDILIPQHLKSRIDEYMDLDFAYEIQGCSRFRVNLSRQINEKALVIRVISYNIKTIQELYLPAALRQFSMLNNGLVLFTGPTGCGKSTTIAALINYINNNYPKHIITIEDPIEFIFTNNKSIISQRQVLLDTPTFPAGIKYALRQDPDVIFIGEIRDTETVISTLEAAETGHLVYATIHTNDAIQTVNRIVNMFARSERQYVREQLAQILRGTVAQKLIPTTDGSGRRPACEVLVCTATIRDFIMKNELDQIYDLVKRGTFDNMLTLNHSLYQLVKAKSITQETALEFSDNRNELSQMLRGVYHGAFAEWE